MDVTKETWNKLNSLSTEQLFELADILSIGIDKEESDKDEIVLQLALCIESEEEASGALKKLAEKHKK